MRDDLNLDRLADIPDPFERHAMATLPPPPRLTASPTRSRVRALRAIAAAGALAYQLAWLALVGTRLDFASMPPSAVALALVVPLGASAVALLAIVGGGTSGLGEWANRPAALVIAPPVIFAGLTVVVANVAASGSQPFADSHVLRCLVQTAVLTVGPLALGAWALRRAFAAASEWRAAALGVACGALAAATMSLACARTGALHVVLGHGTAMIAGGLIGALLGRRITRA